MKNLLFLISVPAVISILFPRLLQAAQSPASDSNSLEEKYEAVVVRIIEDRMVEIDEGVSQPLQIIEAEVVKGSLKGKRITAEWGGLVLTGDDQKVKVGDKVYISHLRALSAQEKFYVTDFLRQNSLYLLTAIFLIAVLLIGGRRGAGSFIGLIFTFIVILKFIIPRILSGGNPLLTSIVGSLIILMATLYLAHGMSRRTTAAVIGTFLSLMITAVLASIFVILSKLSGMASDEASYLSIFPGAQINLRGLLLGGMIIGTLGVLDDISVSQSALVFELKEADKNLSWKELYFRGLKIGKEHIASLVNTLFLAYAGASLPLLLLFNLIGTEPLSALINREMIATEIVRTLVGSLGLILSVPITTAIAAVSAAGKY